MKVRKVALGLVLLSCSWMTVSAEQSPANSWVGGIGVINFSDEEGDLDISVSGLVGSLGYTIESGNNFYFLPEFRFGVGLGDDSVSAPGVDAKVELDRFLALSLRGQYEFYNGLYLFAAPSYANAKFTATATTAFGSASSSDDSWEFGIGGGIGYQVIDKLSAELSYEQFDGTDTFGIGIKFDF